VAAICLTAASVWSQPTRVHAGDIEATLSLSKYSGFPLDQVRVTYKITTVPIGGCWFTVNLGWDDTSAGRTPMEFKSISQCTASDVIFVPLIKPYGKVGKHKVCATPIDIYGPLGPTICRTFTIKAKASATPKPTATPAPTATPTASPTEAPTVEPTTSPSATVPPSAAPATEAPSAAGPTPEPTADPTTASAAIPSTIGFLAGALVGAAIVVIVALRMFRSGAGKPRSALGP
jgi:hypothetical protein